MGFKIAIVGGASSRMDAPFENQAWEIWTCNNCFLNLPRFNRIFELHKISYDQGTYYRRGRKEFRGMAVNDYLRELVRADVPVYMQNTWPDIPQSVRYPIEEIKKRFGRYLTSSISYMLAFAVREGATDIALYGINMGMDDEYTVQKPSIEYLLGYAKGSGVRISVTDDSMLLFTPHMYGYEEILLPSAEDIRGWVNRFQK